jgi:hypothetical protein
VKEWLILATNAAVDVIDWLVIPVRFRGADGTVQEGGYM